METPHTNPPRDIPQPTHTPTTHEPVTARYWHHHGEAIICELCPHHCLLNVGETGICRNRQYQAQSLRAVGYGEIAAINVDPIEKKPFYHLLPGAPTYSIGVAGCNLRCLNCQNAAISQTSPSAEVVRTVQPQTIVKEALQASCPVIACTYTEPLVWIEYVDAIARQARKAGIKTVIVSSGYVDATPFRDLCQVIDGAQIDLKSIDDTTYRHLNGATLKPVLAALVAAKTCGIWLEIANLIIPGWNDSPEQLRELCRWIATNLGVDTPLHFSRFFPQYHLSHLPPTPLATLQRAKAIATEERLQYVYLGNTPESDNSTRCPHCNTVLISRNAYRVTSNNLINGSCNHCGLTIPGVWND